MDRRPIGTKKLPAAFYLQDTVEVARQLIGKRLVHRRKRAGAVGHHLRDRGLHRLFGQGLPLL